MEEIEKQAKQMVANQEHADARIKELETKLQEHIIKTEKLQVMLRGYVVTIRERMEESGRKRFAKQRALKTALKGEIE
jgi:ribosomal protein L16 Arg81 hydroxylase